MAELNYAPITYEAEQAIATPSGQNYKLLANGRKVSLKRNIDFGVIPGTKKPSLYKSGAEAIAMAYGLLQHYEIESKIENLDTDNPFAMYTVRCDLCKVVNGIEYVFTSAYGSANTREKRNGRNSAFDSANTALKMAQKRALTSAAISVSGLSSAFTMDIEDESFNREVDNFVADKEDPTQPITQNQRKRMFAIGKANGLGTADLKTFLAKIGYESSSEILQKDYDAVIAKIQGVNE